MPLPLNTETTIGGVAVVVKSVPEKASGPNRGPSDTPANAADLSVSAYAAPGGSSSYNNRPRGRKIPNFSGLDKALGILGTATALYEAGKSIYQNLKSLTFDASLLKRNVLGNAQMPNLNMFSTNDSGDPIGAGGRLSVTGDRRVKINADFSIFGDNKYFDLLKKTQGVVFPYTPTISITHKANYTATEGIVHSNFPFQAYKSSQIEDITIQGEFTVQNELEGHYWLAAMHFFRTATKMFYGQSVPAGFPPIVCQLSGYGTEILPNLPVVIKSYQLDLKDNVQYLTIPSLTAEGIGTSQSVPVQCTMTVIVSPIYNRQQARQQFDLVKYARGELKGF